MRPQSSEARASKGQEVVVVGGGNFSGPGRDCSLHIARPACALVHRGSDTVGQQSHYLLERFASSRKRQDRDSFADRRSSQGTIACEPSRSANGEGQVVERAVGGLFVMVGADPCTGWPKRDSAADDRGFVLTDGD